MKRITIAKMLQAVCGLIASIFYSYKLGISVYGELSFIIMYAYALDFVFSLKNEVLILRSSKELATLTLQATIKGATLTALTILAVLAFCNISMPILFGVIISFFSGIQALTLSYLNVHISSRIFSANIIITSIVSVIVLLAYPIIGRHTIIYGTILSLLASFIHLQRHVSIKIFNSNWLFLWDMNAINLVASKAKTIHYEIFGIVLKTFISDSIYGLFNLAVKFVRTPIILMTSALGSYSISPSNQLGDHIKRYNKVILWGIIFLPVATWIFIRTISAYVMNIGDAYLSWLILTFILFESLPFITFGVNIQTDLNNFIIDRLKGLGIALLFSFALTTHVNWMIPFILLLAYIYYSFNLLRRTKWN